MTRHTDAPDADTTLFGSLSIPAQLDAVLRERLQATDKRIRALERRTGSMEERLSETTNMLAENTVMTRETAVLIRDIRDAVIAGRVFTRIIKWVSVVSVAGSGIAAAWYAITHTGRGPL